MTSKTAYKRSKWEPGMIYAVPLADGTFGYVQAIAEAMVNVIDVVVLSTRSSSLLSPPPKVERAEVISLAATWRQDLNCGNWAALGVSTLAVDPLDMPNQKILRSGTVVGIKHSSGALISSLIEAWHGLVPWNVLAEEDYFDSKLAPGIRRPSTARLLSAPDREAFRANSAADGA